MSGRVDAVPVLDDTSRWILPLCTALHEHHLDNEQRQTITMYSNVNPHRGGTERAGQRRDVLTLSFSALENDSDNGDCVKRA